MHILKEITAHSAGASYPMSLGSYRGRALVISLIIDIVAENEALEVMVSGSENGDVWTKLIHFPQKCYCGSYFMPLDLRDHPKIAYICVQWETYRLISGYADPPVFGFQVVLEEARYMTA